MDFNTYMRRRKCAVDSNEQSDVNRMKQQSRVNSDDIEKKFKQYSKLSEDELLRSLYDEVNKEKRNGIFDYNAIKEFYKQAAPMMTPKQREKMRSIIESMK